MATLWTKLRLRSCLECFKKIGVYRSGNQSIEFLISESMLSKPDELAKAVEKAAVAVSQLQVELLEGLPVNYDLREGFPDPYLMQRLERSIR